MTALNNIETLIQILDIVFGGATEGLGLGVLHTQQHARAGTSSAWVPAKVGEDRQGSATCKRKQRKHGGRDWMKECRRGVGAFVFL